MVIVVHKMVKGPLAVHRIEWHRYPTRNLITPTHHRVYTQEKWDGWLLHRDTLSSGKRDTYSVSNPGIPDLISYSFVPGGNFMLLLRCHSPLSWRTKLIPWGLLTCMSRGLCMHVLMEWEEICTWVVVLVDKFIHSRVLSGGIRGEDI